MVPARRREGSKSILPVSNRFPQFAKEPEREFSDESRNGPHLFERFQEAGDRRFELRRRSRIVRALQQVPILGLYPFYGSSQDLMALSLARAPAYWLYFLL